MIETWDAGGDFAEVLDTLEPITILCLGCLDEAVETTAWRFREERIAVADSLAALVRTDVTWQIAIAEGERSPMPGDLVIDSAGGCSVLSDVSPLQGATRHICQATRLEIAPASVERFDLVRPIWTETPEGPVVERFELTRPAIAGHLKVLPGDLAEVETGKLYVVSPLPMVVGDRFHRHRGGEYEITQIDEPATLGRPWVVQVSKVTAAV